MTVGELRVAVCAEPPDDAALRAAADAWAHRLGLPRIDRAAARAHAEAIDLALRVTPYGLELEALRGDSALTRGKPMRIDLHKLDTTTGHGRSLRQPLLRAVGLRKGDPYRPTVLDATAGLGEDAWLLAAAGCRVFAVERSAVVAALLEDAIARGGEVEPATASRVSVQVGDSVTVLERLARGEAVASAAGVGAAGVGAVDVVYVDPMFPPGRKTAERKPMRLLRALVGEDVDADLLMAPALRAARRRVVVKRSRRSPPLGAAPPASSHHGRGVRYDVHPALRRPDEAERS